MAWTVKRVNRSAGSLLTLAAVFTSTWTGVRVGGIGPADALLVIAGVLVVVEHALGSRTIILRWWMPLPALGALLVWSTGVMFGDGRQSVNAQVATIFATGVDAEPEYLFVIRLTIATLLLAITVSSEIDSFGPPRAERLLGAWAFGAGLSAASAITDSVGLTDLASVTAHALSDTRAVGLAFHPNSLAQSIALTLPLSLYFTAVRARWGRIFWIAVVGVSMWALFLTNSRGGLIVGLAVTFVTIVLILRRSKRGRSTAVVLVVPAAIAAWWLTQWLLTNTRLGGSGGADLSDAGRWALLQAGLETFSRNLLVGAGLGSGLGVLVPVVLASAGGIVLLCTYYVFILVPFFRALALRNSGLIAACVISIAALIVIGFLNNSVNERYNFVAVACAGALAMGPMAREGNRAVHVSVRTRRHARLTTASLG